MSEWDAELFCELNNRCTSIEDMITAFIAHLGDRSPEATALLEDARTAIDQASLAMLESCPMEILENLTLSSRVSS
jgi:hypothetical protein